MRSLFGALMVFVALSATSRADEEIPHPGQVHIHGLRHEGTGCPAGSVSHLLSPDAKAFTLLFDEFVVEGGEDRRKSNKACSVDVDLHIPPGWSYAIFTLDYRGYARLEDKAQGEQRTTYRFGTKQPVAIGHLKLKGPFDEDYTLRTVTPKPKLSWSGCQGSVRTVRLDTVITVKGTGFMTLDSADGELKHQYGIAYRKCPPGEPPRPNPQPPPHPHPQPSPRNEVLSLHMPGNGFDGDLDLCLNPRTGLLTTNQVGREWRGIVNLQFNVRMSAGLVPVAHVSQTPSTLQLPGDWSGVRDASPVVTSWSRGGGGNPPQIQAFQSGQNRCLRLVDGCCGRPGPVKLAVEWNLVR